MKIFPPSPGASANPPESTDEFGRAPDTPPEGTGAAPLLAVALAGPLGVHDTVRSAGIIQAGMPVAVMATIIAMEFDLAPTFVITVLFFSTLASLLTITVMLSLL